MAALEEQTRPAAAARQIRSPRGTRAVFVGALVVCTLGLLMPLGWLASWSPSGLADSVVPVPLDKLAHFGLFAGLFVLGGRALAEEAKFGALGLKVALVLLLSLVVYGGAIELVQMLIPSRGAEWLDLLADALGALCAGLAALLFAALRLKE